MTQNVLTDAPNPKDLPKIGLDEVGTSGISQFLGVIGEERKVDLAFPYSSMTYKEMGYDSAVSSALGAVQVLVNRAQWSVTAPEGADEAKAEFLRECIADMEKPLTDYLKQCLSYLQYGYSLSEIVFKRREGLKGKRPSKYDDGKIGWAKLPIRSQATIDKWIYTDDMNSLVGYRQNLELVNHDARLYLGNKQKDNPKHRLIPLAKSLHFRWNPERDNPEGRSPLANCYISWRYKTTIEEYEAIGVSRDLGGLPVVELPVEFMAEDASPEHKAIYEYFKNVVRNIQANESAGVIIPKFFDPDSKKDQFGFRLEGVSGGKQYDTNSIVNRYENKILMAFFADILKMGQDAVGSFALSDNKNNLLTFMVEEQLKIIADVLNHQLIPQTFKMNGWTDKVLPKFEYSDIEDADLDIIGSFIQRIVAVGAIEVDKDLSDYLRGLVDLKPADATRKMDEDLLPAGKSRSGDGMGSGMPNSTSDNTDEDTSKSNKANK